jgi:hypothetical protein
MRQFIKLIAVSLPLIAVAACSDVSTGPQASASRSLSAAPTFDYTGGGRFRMGEARTSFTVTPAGGSFAINRLITVDFPAGSICDPDVSSYGPGEWDSACATLTHAITITATTRLTGNGMAVDFQPDLRFSPDKQVTLSTDLFASTLRANRWYFRTTPEGARPLAFLYSPSLGGAPVADYASDPTLVTRVDLETGRVWRRVKHFSGYVSGSGAACNPAAGDPDCVAVHAEATP